MKTIEELQEEISRLKAENTLLGIEKKALKQDLKEARAKEEPLEWVESDWGPYQCPKCKRYADEDEYNGKDRLTPYCQYCGQRLVIPANADPKKVFDGIKKGRKYGLPTMLAL